MKKIAVGWLLVPMGHGWGKMPAFRKRARRLLVPMGHGWGKMPAFRRRARRLLIVGYCLDPEGITYY
ncbi:MAG: hypothetical protein ACLFN2_01180 [Bacteroidales bacterium]